MQEFCKFLRSVPFHSQAHFLDRADCSLARVNILAALGVHACLCIQAYNLHAALQIIHHIRHGCSAGKPFPKHARTQASLEIIGKVGPALGKSAAAAATCVQAGVRRL